MTINVRGADYQENLDNDMGLEFYDLSHRWGLGQPCWPYFEDVRIERLHSMAKSGVLTQRITTVMHSGTHIDAPGHVVEGTAFMDEVPLPPLLRHGRRGIDPQGPVGGDYGADDLENATPDDPRGRHRRRQYRLAPALRRQPDLLRLLPGFLQGGRRVVRREEGQDGRHRHPGARPSAWVPRSRRTARAGRTG